MVQIAHLVLPRLLLQKVAVVVVPEAALLMQDLQVDHLVDHLAQRCHQMLLVLQHNQHRITVTETLVHLVLDTAAHQIMSGLAVAVVVQVALALQEIQMELLEVVAQEE
jgi:hypothetical protein